MELVSDYMRDEKLRHALNELTQKTFGFDFEGWVTEGYFEGDYIPYSFIEDGKMLANVSVNRMHFLQNGVEKNYIQIGTVMTDEAYRKQGLAGKLMQHVLEIYRDKCDGIYLFGNPEATGFYEKMGFNYGMEYRYFVKEDICRKISDERSEKQAGKVFVKVNSEDSLMKDKYKAAVRNGVANSSFEQINKYGLQLFYTADLENVYYAEDIDCFIVAEAEEENLLLQSIICPQKISLVDVLKRIDTLFYKCSLGFTPAKEDMESCVGESYDGADDYRLFFLGEELESVGGEKLYFPELSHA